MAHFVDTMAYAGEIPWHGLGKYIGDQNVSADVMRKAAGLDFDVRKLPAFVQTPEGAFVPIADRYGMLATHKREAFSAVVSDRYEVFQTEHMFDFLERLRGAAGGELKFHTAGALKGGSVVWALAQLAGSIDVRRRGGAIDRSAPFLFVSNSFDGSSAIEIAATSVRIVCWNTLSAAVRGSKRGKDRFSVRHTASAEQQLSEAAASLGYASEYFAAYQQTAQELADTPMNREAFTAFAARLLTGIDDERAALEKVSQAKGRSETILNNTADALIGNFVRGRGNHGQDAFDALQAVTEYVDHQRGRMGRYSDKAKRLGALDKAMDSAINGQGADLKSRALRLLTR
jgi:phage/plasmid-like protein (TIGR03299 family)